jgi:hypothetical protein
VRVFLLVVEAVGIGSRVEKLVLESVMEEAVPDSVGLDPLV